MLLVTRAPLRLVLSAETHSAPRHVERHEGTFISATVGYHAYSLITPGPARGIRIISSDCGAAYELLSCEHTEPDSAFGVAKASICYLNLCDGITVSLASELPPHSGLSLANASATALIKGLAFWSGLDLGAAEVADLAGNIEDETGDLGVSKPDTYAIALGGLNIVHRERNRVNIEPFSLSPSAEARLEASLMLFLTPLTADAFAHSLAPATRALPAIDEIEEINSRIQTALLQGDVEQYGQYLDQAKSVSQRNRAEPTTPLESGYSRALSLGAWGGRISEDECGSGSLMLVCPPQHQEEVTEALIQSGLQYRPIAFSHEGVQLFQTMPWPTAQTWQDLYVNRQEVHMLR